MESSRNGTIATKLFVSNEVCEGDKFRRTVIRELVDRSPHVNNITDLIDYCPPFVYTTSAYIPLFYKVTRSNDRRGAPCMVDVRCNSAHSILL